MLRSRRQVGCGPLTAVPIPTRAGTFMARFSDHGLAELDFPGRTSLAPNLSSDKSCPAPIPQWSALTKAALEAALLGESPSELPPLDMRVGTDFQRSVWAALRRIPVGQTRSYGDLAREIGSVGATRAVGSACGANPIPVLIPCHRVLASGGKLGGFSSGLDWKVRLLSIEGAWSSGAKAGSQTKFSF